MLSRDLEDAMAASRGLKPSRDNMVRNGAILGVIAGCVLPFVATVIGLVLFALGMLNDSKRLKGYMAYSFTSIIGAFMWVIVMMLFGVRFLVHLFH